MQSKELQQSIKLGPDIVFEPVDGVVYKNGMNGNEHAEPHMHLVELLAGRLALDADYEKPDVADWSRRDFIRWGHWMHSIAQTASPPQVISGDIISRARDLGLGPSARQITHPDRFGSLGKFYLAISKHTRHDMYPTRRSGVFDEWDVNQFVSYLSRVGESLGRRPNESDIYSLAKSDLRNPTPKVIATRCGGSFNRALELAGYVVVPNWSREDYIEWGKKFRYANPGLPLSVTALDYLSHKQNGPSRAAVARNFGKVRNLISAVELEYEADLEQSELEQADKLSKIKALTDEQGPISEIFMDVTYDTERIKRYARYVVADNLLSKSQTESKITIAKMEAESAIERGFIGSIKKVNDSITAGDIESTALYLGVFDDIWPPDSTILDKLRVPENVIRQRRMKTIEPIAAALIAAH